ncbi:S53 family peptidase [Streptomyces sp. SL13]|uniref:S53 family peptidase n=1 Tax=Streptantibioticus silvisoli TaxID=2705255 RepID=A0AA90H1D9_9ACTN|nr:S53 family peptidase [Streptantibioticus silvisoli]MDI5966690.1 S53 family peptidase [Streptantibioticus silvisoli]MDI5972258.1 S53 family peptidase [Streptantibioticus silvisoli]
MRVPTDIHVGVVITDKLNSRGLRGRRIAVAAAASLALASGSVALAVPSQASAPTAGPKTISGSHPAWATAAKDAGTASASTEFTGTVYLAGQNSAELSAYAQAVSDPHSAQYDKFLTAAQAKARFGTTTAQVAAVRGWLTGAGLTVVSSSEHAITIKGTNAAVSKAFGTSIHQYKVAGTLRHAPARNVSVPASVSASVLGVTGLSSAGSNHAKPDSVKVSTAAVKGAKPSDGLPTTATCSDYWGQKLATGAPAGYVNGAVPFDQCSFQPSQLRKAYGITSSGLTGKGATVAIIDAYGSSTMESDANTYAANHGDKPFKAGQYTEDVTPAQWEDQDECGGPEGWLGEESLDVEMVHGLAPDADVHYVGANSCTDDDLLAAISSVVDKHSADVITNSWGEIMHTSDNEDITATEIAAYTQVFEQAAAEGITINFSAGDCGDSSPLAAATGANCQTDTSRAQANWPDSSPWVTSVGGTALGLASKSGSYGFETDMGNARSALSTDGKSWTPLPAPFYFGGGGGTSEDFKQPWYQSWGVPSATSHTLMTGAHSASAMRVTPDVAMNGDLYTSVLVGMTDGGAYSEGGYGGTSVASPEFAAVQADAIQGQHHAIGFANPEIYVRSTLGLFKDVVDQAAAHHQAPLSNVADFGEVNGALAVRLVSFGTDTSLNAVKGYDDATGVGSPTLNYLRSFK